MSSKQDPRDHLIYLTNRVARQLSATMIGRFVFEGFQPQGTHLGIVADLFLRDGQRQQDLAIATIKDKGTIARSLTTLEEEGFVRRVRDDEDRRQKRIYLTKRGRDLWRSANDLSVQTMALATEEISPEEVSTCISVLQRVHYNLNQQLTHPTEAQAQ